MDDSSRGLDAPLSFAQESLFVISQTDAVSALYNVPYIMEFSGEIDADLLEYAFCRVIERHEILRTAFFEHQGEVVQRIRKCVDFKLQKMTISRLEIEAGDWEMERDRFSRLPFDLAKDILIRAMLVDREEDRPVLLLVLHHIIYDGGSADILANELAQAYQTALAEPKSRWPALPVQYADYAVWQRQAFDAGYYAGDLAYWIATLDGANTCIDLPYDFSRPARQIHSGGIEEINVSPALCNRIFTCCGSANVTPFSLLLSAINVLLSNYSRQLDINIGMPVHGRISSEMESVIGLFANMVVLRTQLSHSVNFIELLGTTQRTVIDAYEHHGLPFGKLVEALEMNRPTSGNPLFQVCVADHQPEQHWRLGDSSAEFVGFQDTGVSKFDLTFYVSCIEPGLSIKLEYSRELFLPETPKRLLKSLLVLIDKLVNAPCAAVLSHLCIDSLERDQLLSAGCGAAVDLGNLSIIDLFTRQVQHNPSAVAIRDQGRSLTYRQLNEESDRRSQALYASGCGLQTSVGVVCNSLQESVTAILAILKAGAVYVPLDPTWPTERLQRIIGDAQIRWVVVDSTLQPSMSMKVGDASCIDLAATCLLFPSKGIPHPYVSPAQLAYITYTSGSTGVPKGVAVPHRAVIRLIQGTDYLPLDNGLTFAQLSHFSFDAFTLELWGALLKGGCLVGFPGADALAPEHFRDYLQAERITSLFVTMPLLTQLSQSSLNVFEGVQHLMFGGDRASVDTLRRLRRMGFEGQLINGYGPTESTTFACTHHVGDGELNQSCVPIGLPIANTQVYVLNSEMMLMPVGVVGELYIGGAGLAQGYKGQPKLTAERFVPDPFSPASGSRLYRTGDLCFWDDSFTLRYLSRADDQVKINGFRIEKEEVRLALLACEGVSQAVVECIDSEVGKYLSAFIVPEPALSRWIDPEQIRHCLLARLPAYMVPADFRMLTALPLTPNGKLDRVAMCAAAQEVSLANAHPGVSDLVERVLSIVESVLGRPFQHNQTFIAAGGSSMRALTLVMRLKAEFGRAPTLTEVMNAPNLLTLARKFESESRDNGRSQHIERVSPRGFHPLSSNQAGLYFLWKMDPGSLVYDVPLHIDFVGKLDHAALNDAFLQVVATQEVLKARFVERDGAVFQTVEASFPFALEYEVVQCPDEWEEVSRCRFSEFCSEPYDLREGSVFRAKLLTTDAGYSSLFIRVHHIVFDGQSLPVLLQALSHGYELALGTRHDPLPSPRSSYFDFACSQYDEGFLRQQETALAYWCRTLQGTSPVLNLPLDHRRPVHWSGRGENISYTIPLELTHSIQTAAERYSTTPYVVFVTGVALLLSAYSGQKSFCLGFPAAGRPDSAFDGTVGFFATMLALRVDVSGVNSFADCLGQVRASMLEALDRGGVPLDKLLGHLEVERSQAFHPLFQVCVTTSEPSSELMLNGFPGVDRSVSAHIAKFDLSFDLQCAWDQWHVTLNYALDLFEEATPRLWLDQLVALLTQGCDLPEVAVAFDVPPPENGRREKFRRR